MTRIMFLQADIKSEEYVTVQFRFILSFMFCFINNILLESTSEEAPLTPAVDFLLPIVYSEAVNSHIMLVDD